MAVGIYKIESISCPEKFYIGSSINTRVRRNVHFYLLKYNKHPNNKLQNHYNKYGKNDLRFVLLEECSKENIITIEQNYLDNYPVYFNICKQADRPSYAGHSVSTEHKQKLSLLMKNNTHSRGNKGCKGKISNRAKSIIQYDLKGNIINNYPSAYAASLENKIGRQAINNNLTGRSKSSGGFIWKYKNI